MSWKYYDVGLHNVGSYQVSGKPFLTSSTAPASGSAVTPLKITFPFVTKKLVLMNNEQTANEDMRFAMSARGVRDEVSNYFVVHAEKDGNGYLELDIKCTEVHLMSDGSHTASFSLYAALTSIPVERVTNISPSGSNWSGSAGIG